MGLILCLVVKYVVQPCLIPKSVFIPDRLLARHCYRNEAFHIVQSQDKL